MLTNTELRELKHRKKIFDAANTDAGRIALNSAAAQKRRSPEDIARALEPWTKNSAPELPEGLQQTSEFDRTNEQICEDFTKWMIKPVDANMMATLNSLQNFGIKLSKEELTVLKDALQDSYFGSKILAEIARQNGYVLKTPDTTEFMSALHQVEDFAGVAVRSYAGKNSTDGADLLGQWTVGGVDCGDIPIWQRVNAARYLEKDTTLSDAQKLWDASHVPSILELPEPE